MPFWCYVPFLTPPYLGTWCDHTSHTPLKPTFSVCPSGLRCSKAFKSYIQPLSDIWVTMHVGFLGLWFLILLPPYVAYPWRCGSQHLLWGGVQGGWLFLASSRCCDLAQGCGHFYARLRGVFIWLCSRMVGVGALWASLEIVFVCHTSSEETGCISLLRDTIFIWPIWLEKARLFFLMWVGSGSQAMVTLPCNGGLSTEQGKEY